MHSEVAEDSSEGIQLKSAESEALWTATVHTKYMVQARGTHMVRVKADESRWHAVWVNKYK